jgi:ATP-binding cassette subfamily B protein/subfamily B ATP-binding cassette protein MsbA
MAFQGRSIQDRVDEKVRATEEDIGNLDHRLQQAAQRWNLMSDDDPDAAGLESEITEIESDLRWQQWTLGWLQPTQSALDRYVPRDPFQTLAILVGVLFLATIVKNFFLMLNMVLVARLSQLGTFELRKLFFSRTLQMDVATFTSEGTSDLMSRFTHDMQNVVVGLNALLGKLIREPLKLIACLIGAALVCWQLLVLSLVVAPLAAWLIRVLARTLKRANRKAMEEMAQLYSVLGETFQAIKIVKAFTMERQERQRFHVTSKKYFKKSMKIGWYDAWTRPVTEILGIVIICLAMLAGAYLVLRGETALWGIPMTSRPMSWPTLLIFYGLLVGTADPARKLSDVFSQLQAGVAAADRIYALLDREPKVRDPEHPRSMPRHNKDLVFEGVDFAYQPDHPVLHDIDLSIRFGETVAIVGPSGCGKSTLANLICRFADPTAGVIRLDGVPLPEVRIRDLRGQIGLVTQDPLLFDDTVLNNIRYGSPGASDEAVIEAAKQAHAHRFIEDELPDGYQTIVGPLGGQLSGGQRQRIALARAILRNPTLLILDEATSQVDLESERLIQTVMEQFIRGRTAVIITHRLGALVLADRIVVMQDGRILDAGAHHELIARCELYRRLYQIQFDDLKQSA